MSAFFMYIDMFYKFGEDTGVKDALGEPLYIGSMVSLTVDNKSCVGRIEWYDDCAQVHNITNKTIIKLYHCWVEKFRIIKNRY